MHSKIQVLVELSAVIYTLILQFYILFSRFIIIMKKKHRPWLNQHTLMNCLPELLWFHTIKKSVINNVKMHTEG